MGISFNSIQNINSINPIKQNIGFRGVTNPQDSFQSTMTPEMIVRKKFDALFPNGGINKIYDQINKDFKIDNPAELSFVYDETSQLGGGFTFNKNQIEMNIYDLMHYDKKIVGIKNGKKYPIISPSEKIPLFVDKQNGERLLEIQSKQGNLGFDKLVMEDVTPKEHRKFIIQKIAHECVHAKQHQILRETEGIGDKEIIKAWTHAKPKNLAEEKSLDNYAEKRFQDSPWAKVPPAEIKHKKVSPTYQKAMILLDAIRNYPPVDSPLYTKNPLEREAFEMSALYVRNIMV